MPQLISLLNDRTTPFHTFEFFPPRTEAGLVNLLDRIQRLASAPLPSPLTVSVTWGAGGSTADKSLELAEQIVKLGLKVILHLTCTNMPKEKVDQALEKCKSLGVRNILALRGDAPRSEEYSTDPNPQPDYFQHADDLVRYIRKNYDDYFCIGVAGYPTPHPDSETAEKDLEYLKIKCDAGADFIVTQLFYDVEGFLEWVKICRRKGITQPIIPGIMPIQNFASFRRLVNLTKCPVPETISSDLLPISSDDSAVKRYGAELATKMVKQILESQLVPGIHFCTLNLEKSVRTILENLHWTNSNVPSINKSPLIRHNRLIEDDQPQTNGAIAINGHTTANGLGSGHQISDLSVSPSEASQLAQWGLQHHSLPPVPKKGGIQGGATSNSGQGAEDSWDEYPNGRFTDVRSPAYGEIDGWGSGLKITAAQALKEWGTPTTVQELSAFFTSYLRASPETPTTPFCDLPLSPESQTILPHLLELNSEKMKCWTVGSQPCVDAIKSEDPIHGWGPRGGYVFQKAFVEFFVKEEEVQKLKEKVELKGQGKISMYAGNKSGSFRTNTEEDTVNAVTWGVFPGQEIVQSTIIETESFLAWKEEAFDIWTEWSLLYPRHSPARKLLESIAGEWWLVSLIHHDYKDKEALWRFLLDE
ncbi:methylenetetrahydrofolate reductase [Kwoniella dejecticola CBS 10117]|uniref:Methylenetetrahydrofolate reductase n=1 Tax=Kwoniella dejecticola CBS 10117 TaxID=1296121 RepID=A0A1A5ZVP4_9TREE|nr:methylenetetrahydrofolate reductase [Kwoniella dejecticola CBS 10117]OBR81872.1 methylenetetrahydrofolate reductase [Kwoniella dejecticola CBS 10117]